MILDRMEALREALNKFEPLGEEEWTLIQENTKFKVFEKGDFLCRQGQTEKYIYFLLEGATRNYFYLEGKEYTVDFHFRGDLVTGYYSLITGEPSEVSIEAIERIESILIPFSFLKQFYDTYPKGERMGRKIAEYQYVKRLRREMDLLSLTAEQKYLKLMDRNPGLVQNLSVKHLSSYLGIQPESLSRIRKSSIHK